jgi:hypothetical protein
MLTKLVSPLPKRGDLAADGHQSYIRPSDREADGHQSYIKRAEEEWIKAFMKSGLVFRNALCAMGRMSDAC